MTRESQIVELAAWLQTPPGRYLLAWEQARLDEAVADLFGFHALQLGLPELQSLRGNRMPHRWLALDSLEQTLLDWPLDERPAAVSLHCEFDALPFESSSLDLVVLPHALELALDPHLTLREVERVLRPEGRLVILGLNPASLWGLRQNLGRLASRFRLRRDPPLFLPRAGDFIGYWRLRDWLRLLSFEVEQAQFGCYRPPLRSAAWLARWQWLERLGPRWWTVLGAVYFVVAVKRVHGMRLVGLARQQRRQARGASAVALNSHPHPSSSSLIRDP
ncbi:class I SAM-dependent methyltransferase [Paucibacter soli]|uniref:class I SAM-dependent methyltransferase n=1 Tax=Paucibacter soli TaxID=3133433 RepID=UPI0030B21EDF